ncbi:hypothetical protein [Myxosarcina sp. GI1(2024)]
MLTLLLPKAEEARQRTVKISLGDTNSASSLPETESVEAEAAVANA